MQRLAGAIAGVLCVIVGSVPVAAAAATTDAVGGQPLLSVRTPMVEDDAAIIATASGLCPGQDAYFVLTGRNGSITGPNVDVRSNGTARQTFAAARTNIGDYSVWVKQRPFGDQTCHKTGVTVVRVVADCSTAPDAVVVQQSDFRRHGFGGLVPQDEPGDGIIDVIVDILTPPLPPDPETTTTTVEETTTTVAETTTSTEAPTTTAEPTTTTEAPAPATTADPTTTTESPAPTTEAPPAPTTTDAPMPPAFPGGMVACDPGPEAAAPVPTSTAPGTDGTTDPAIPAGPAGSAGTGDDNPRSTEPAAGGTAPGGTTGGTGTQPGDTSAADADAAATQDPATAVVTQSEPDGDAVDLAVTRYTEGPSKVKAGGFCTSSLVTFTLGGVVVGAVLAAPDGTAAFNVPASALPDEPGVYEVIAVSNGNEDPSCDMSERTTYVVPAEVASSPPTVKTGASSGQTGVSALGPLVVAGQLNRRVLDDAGMPITGSNPNRILRFATGAVLAGMVLMVLVGIRRRSPHDDSLVESVVDVA